MSDYLTPSLHDQLSDANVPSAGLPDELFVQDEDAFPPDAELTDEDLNYLAEREAPLMELLRKSIELETEKRRPVTVPAGLLRDVLELRQLQRKYANWHLENDEREEARYRAEQIERAIRKAIGEDRRTA